MTHISGKNLEISYFEVVDVLFRELRASSVTWTSFMGKFFSFFGQQNPLSGLDPDPDLYLA